MKKFDKAFSLAEILITLSILGIVAAIGISSLVQNYKKRMVVTRLKIAYSMLNDLTRISYAENGYPPIDATSANPVFNTYFGKYLNITKRCGMWNQTMGTMGLGATGCFKQGTSTTYQNGVYGPYVSSTTGKEYVSDMFYDLDGNDYNQGGYGPSAYYMVVLKNGMGLGVSLNNAKLNGWSIIVDIDGPNHGDSKLGQDVFQFTYYAPVLQRNNNCKNVGLLPGAIRPGDMDTKCYVSRETLKNRCKAGGNNDSPFRNGSGCSGLIIRDGWKISEDYPWALAQKKLH